MPQIIEYVTVVDQLANQGLQSLYHNSGAFGFAAAMETVSRGWIGPEDSSIRESARSMVRYVSKPYAQRMSKLMIQIWRESLPGSVWVLPRSHWSYELEFGSRDWLGAALERIGVDATALAPLNNAAAIEFSEGEGELLEFFVWELLEKLVGSDFQMVFPGRNTICTIHARTQLWWTTLDSLVAHQLDLNEDPRE